MSPSPGEPLLERLRAAAAGRYRVERAAGRGGMATVFLGEDLKHRRRVAIKVLDPELGALLGGDRFAREIEVAARLQHPHIVTLLDSGSGDGLFWYVMPWVEGQSLRARLEQEGRLGVEETARLGAQIAYALDYAHRQGVVHRDIKPENILLADGQAMVTDFGIARAIRAAGGPSLTGTGVMLGTPEYMSPEQVTGERELDGRSDVYGLGCVLYEMLAGQPPFTGPAAALGHQHLSVAPRPLADLRPGTPPRLAAAIERALAKAPGDRFATAGQLAEALEASAPVAAMPAPDAPASPRRRRAAAVAGAALALVALALAWRFGAFEALLPRPTEASERQWVWLAAFDGPADDPTLAPGARDVVGSALDESGLLASVPQEQARIALRNAGRPDTARVDEELARQLAYRSGVRVVVGGRVARLGRGYRIALRAVDAENGQVLVAPAANAADDRALIPALTGLARELRRGLGERPEALRARAGIFDAATPSFEAFKLYSGGRRLINANESESAIPLLRQAVAIDPEFGAAWAALGTAQGNAGLRDSALAAFGEALRHPERLGEAKRLEVLAKIDNWEGRHERAIERYDALIALDPTPADKAVALNNKANALAVLGRYDEALPYYHQAAEAWPVEPPPLTLVSIGGVLIALGRIDEARAIVPKVAGPAGGLFAMEIAFHERRWESGDSIASILRSRPGTANFFRIVATIAHASALGARGRVGEAREVLSQVDALAAGGPPEMWQAQLWWNRVLMDLVSGQDPAAERPLHASVAREVSEALLAAWVGDSLRAHRAIERTKKKVGDATADLARAWLDRRQGHWSAVIDRLAPLSRDGRYEPGSPQEQMRQAARWMVAEAFSRAGRPDSASAYLGLMLEPPAGAPHVIVPRGLIEPFVRARLVRVLAGSGRIEQAGREWETLSRTVTRPDAEMLAVLDDTRAAMQSAGAMQAASRR